ncbi:MAG: nucleotidyltransferase family protein, partial [Actinobacteria bacterium]|nr:nucleotidyltransferase family protein [Actinomycetota bacterium]
ELLGILDLLKAHGIPAVPFNGPAQAVSVMGRLALREFVDLDILVHRQDALKARELLAARGYVTPYRFTHSQEKAYLDSRGEYYLYRPKDGTRVEIHWKLLPDYFAIPFDVEKIWSRLGSVSLGNATVPALAPEDLLLLLCIHGYSHMWERLEWICGLAELIRQREVEWGMVLQRARELGTTRILLLGLEMAGGLLEAPLPGEILRLAREDPEVARLAEHLRGRLLGEKEPAGIAEIVGFQLRSRERLRDKAKFLLRLTTTSTAEEWSAVAIPDALFPLYRLVRPVALARKYLLGASASNGRSLSEG